MELTRLLLPAIGDGVIAPIGGFADGRLAFPFYSADVAARAGLRAFSESVNRELALDGGRATISFFSPSPADTAAERPFHALWRAMGTPIVPPDRVAAALVGAVARRRQVVISTLAYLPLLAVPFLAVDAGAKLGISAALVTGGELTFWVGAALLGRELVARLRRYLNPCTWFSR